MENRNLVSRRRVLATATVAANAAAQTGRTAVKVGIATTEFRTHTNAALAKEFREAGIKTIQLFLPQTDSNYWKYNGRSDLAGLGPERSAEIAGIYRSAGISIHSIGVYANLIHPDAAERKANLAYFEAMMKVGHHMGVHVFISEAGHYREPMPGEPYHWREDVWRTMVGTARELAAVADANNATVLLEPYFEGFLATAKRTRVFIEEVGSPRIRALLDPANLIESNDLEEMFQQLGPYIDCFHAKDRKLHVIRGVAAGQGDVDYRRFVTLAAEKRPSAPLIIEYAGASSYRQALAHLRKAIRDAGLAEA